jgi:hypothetical protein
MLQVNIKQLVAAVQKAAPFALPEMSAGTNYLYNSLYNRLSTGEDVLLSDLDFSAFNSEDIRTLHSLYNDVFEKSNRQADGIISTLRQITPACKDAAYV